ncbi:ribosome silencing factor [Corynebacterium hindlerae]|uniref:Ribosomal silencing factor RsfS n=1 Tax=Corynebacterium hindlerae TaxID=699041 RepID=A0A7G5FDV5_9CORY|nr:ribosome silencing factor [Corynebacterium hindlerae]QMV84796.1 ribosome silencing factor [Corynebacterium hindlerae]
MTASQESIRLASIAALAADDKLAEEIAVIDVSDVLTITDVFVIASASNERQVNAIVEEIEDKLTENKVEPIRREGTREGRWALLDYGEFVIHIFRTQEREYYGLDRLWRDCPLIDVEGIDTLERPKAWETEVNEREVSSIDEIPLAENEPDEDEL